VNYSTANLINVPNAVPGSNSHKKSKPQDFTRLTRDKGRKKSVKIPACRQAGVLICGCYTFSVNSIWKLPEKTSNERENDHHTVFRGDG